VKSALADAELELDGKAAGVTCRGTTLLSGVKSGTRRLLARDRRGRTIELALAVPRSGALEVSTFDVADDRPWLRDATLWSGVALAAGGTALTVYALSASGDRVLCPLPGATPECGRAEFTSFGGGRLPIAPLGYGLIAAGATWALGALVFERDEPWFAHLSFLSPHPPFIVPAPYNRMYDPADGPLFRRAASREAESAIHPYVGYALAHQKRSNFLPGHEGIVADWDEAAFRQIRAIYYGMISEVDAQVGRVFDGIKAQGAWDDTVIVLTSDHAEMMGEQEIASLLDQTLQEESETDEKLTELSGNINQQAYQEGGEMEDTEEDTEDEEEEV